MCFFSFLSSEALKRIFINLQALIWAQMIKKHDQTDKVNRVKLGSFIISVAWMILLEMVYSSLKFNKLLPALGLFTHFKVVSQPKWCQEMGTSLG